MQNRKNNNDKEGFGIEREPSVPHQAAQSAQKEKTFANINTKAFLTVLIMLLAILTASALLSFFIPQGSYARIDEKIDINSFTYGKVKGIAAWRVITAPLRVFASEESLTVIMISIFLLIMSGVFNIVEKTGGIKSIIKYTKKRFAAKKRLILCLIVLTFMAFGSFFGMFEELVALLPIVVILALSLGFDTLTGLGMCMMAACFGFSAAITNPFSVGLASNIVNVKVLDGMYLRVILFVLIYAMVCGFLLLHNKRIAASPQKSLTYESDRTKIRTLNDEKEDFTSQDKAVFKTYVIFFGTQLVILLTAAAVSTISSYAIPILSLSFLIGGLLCGHIITRDIKSVLKWLGQGVLSMLPAIVMIALASSVKLVMTESGIIDTVLHAVIEQLKNRSAFSSILIIYALILFLQIFIGSASAKIFLIMPLLFDICSALGISPNLIILTYCMADGFTDVILPTNPVLLIGLSMTGVSYGKWFRFTWWFQLAVFALTLLMLFIGIKIGY
ncbi:MAG: YfcC family protein [Lachnospiraceae bacterium]|nr:YfcC family protein [Lachnospiraceae bacterium]